MDIEPDQRVSWIAFVMVVSMVFVFLIIPAQSLSPSAANVFYMVFMGFIAVLVFGVIGWDLWKNGLPEKEKRRRDDLRERMFHWTVGVPDGPEQFYIFLMTLGGGLFIFSSVFWMLQSPYIPEGKRVLMALFPVLLFHLGKLFAEINLHFLVHSQRDVESRFYWRYIVGFIVKLSVAAGVYAGVWYILKWIFRTEQWSIYMVIDTVFVFYLLGGAVFSIDFGDLYDRVGGSIFLNGLVLVFALVGLYLLSLLYSTFLIELGRTWP